MNRYAVQVRLLGPLEVVVDGTTEVPSGLRRKAVLASLALRAGTTVSTGQLVDTVWGSRPPTTAANTLQSHVSYLRRVLGPGWIVARAPGYFLDLAADCVDVTAAEKLIRRGRESGRPASASAADLAAALAMWRGPALADLEELPWFHEQAERLENLRLDAVQAQMDVRLQLGEHVQITTELETLVDRYVLREPFHAQLMLALYRSGRQADALAVYRRLRQALGEELGLEPGPSPRELETAILRQDPSLDPPVAPLAVAPRTPVPGSDRSGDLDGLLAAGDRALSVAGDLRAARHWFDAAYRAAEDRGDREAMARAALGLSGLWVHENRTALDAARVRVRQHHALARIDGGSVLSLRLRTRLAAEHAFRSGRYETLVPLLAEAESRGDAVPLAEALSLAHQCLRGPDHGPERLMLAQHLIDVAARSNRRIDVQLGLLWWTVDLFTTAHPHAERALAELRHHLDSEDHLAIGSITAAMDVMLTIRRGRLTDAEAMAAACAERAAATADASAAARFAAHLAAIRWYQGRLTAVLPRLSQLVHSPLLAATDDSLLAVLATATAMAGDRPRAASMLARLRGANLADLPRSATWLATLYGVAEVADLLDDADAAGEVYHLLAPFAHLPVMGHWAVICLGSVQHALGVAALTMRDPHRAVAHLHAAVRDNLALGHLPATALSRARLAQALVLRHGPDTDAARRQRVQAAGEAAAMGMTLPQDHDAHRVTPPHL